MVAGKIDLESFGGGSKAENVIEELTKLRGIGHWTAELVMIRGMGRFDAIAYVDTDAPADLLTFIQNVSRNRGLPLRVFNSVATAEQWLATSLEERSCAADADE